MEGLYSVPGTKAESAPLRRPGWIPAHLLFGRFHGKETNLDSLAYELEGEDESA
jgi:hypothetical protein